MHKLFLPFLVSSFTLFGAGSASSSSAKLTEQKKVGPFEIGQFDPEKFLVTTNTWPKVGRADAGAIALLAELNSDAFIGSGHSTMAGWVVYQKRLANTHMFNPFVLSLPAALAEIEGKGIDPEDKIVELWAAQMAAWGGAYTIVRGGRKINLWPKVALLLAYRNIVYIAQGSWREGIASVVPYIDGIEKLMSRAGYEIILPDRKFGDGSPIVTWIKPRD